MKNRIPTLDDYVSESNVPTDADYNFLIDQLSNSMEFYTANDFLHQISKETAFNRKDIKKMFSEYWKLDALVRSDNDNLDWKEWIDKMIGEK